MGKAGRSHAVLSGIITFKKDEETIRDVKREDSDCWLMFSRHMRNIRIIFKRRKGIR